MPLRFTKSDGTESVASGYSAPDSTTGEATMPRTDKQLDTEPPDQSDERRRAREKGGPVPKDPAPTSPPEQLPKEPADG
jgi:hypothetical protein